MNNGLNIIKARVEQDKYAAVELKIIKADGKKIDRDLYVEKEINGGEFYVVSDNVLVALHRTLRSGDIPNLEVISNKGDVLIEPSFSKIDSFEDNLFVCTKSVSSMISVENNQNSKKDALKVQEIANTSTAIKEQMSEVMSKNNPNNDTFKFIFDDAYNEARVYHIVKDGDGYRVDIVADNASFVAYDGINLYSHSNIVTDNTRVEIIGTPTITGDSNLTPIVEENLYSKFAPKRLDDKKDDTKDLYVKFAPKKLDEVKNDDISDDGTGEGGESNYKSKSLFKKFAPKRMDAKKEDKDENLYEKYAPKRKNSKKVEAKPIPVAPADVFTEDVIEPKDEKSELADSTFDTFFDLIEEDKNEDKKDSKKKEKKESKKEKTDVKESNFDDDIIDDEESFDKLSDMINKLIEKDRNSSDMIAGLNDQIDNLNDKLDKMSRELESKTKKNNDLINDNRKLNDENRTLKSRISSLEEDNSKYLEENKKLRREAKDSRNRINAVISTIGEVLDSYDEKVLVKKAS